MIIFFCQLFFNLSDSQQNRVDLMIVGIIEYSCLIVRTPNSVPGQFFFGWWELTSKITCIMLCYAWPLHQSLLARLDQVLSAGVASQPVLHHVVICIIPHCMCSCS